MDIPLLSLPTFFSVSFSTQVLLGESGWGIVSDLGPNEEFQRGEDSGSPLSGSDHLRGIVRQ